MTRKYVLYNALKFSGEMETRNYSNPMYLNLIRIIIKRSAVKEYFLSQFSHVILMQLRKICKFLHALQRFKIHTLILFFIDIQQLIICKMNSASKWERLKFNQKNLIILPKSN